MAAEGEEKVLCCLGWCPTGKKEMRREKWGNILEQMAFAARQMWF